MGWTETWFGVNGALLHRWRTKALFPSTPLIRKLREPAAFCAAHAALQAMAAQGNSVQLAACAMTCLGVALEGLEIGHRGDLPTLTGDELVNRSIEFILLNCHRPLTVAGVAAAVHSTRRTLERAYACVHERTVAEEIAWHRVERARLMLMEGNMSVKEIGYAAGFGGAKRLLATFRRLKVPIE
jgi:transcriptional regulator GlxA family with amidase domain